MLQSTQDTPYHKGPTNSLLTDQHCYRKLFNEVPKSVYVPSYNLSLCVLSLLYPEVSFLFLQLDVFQEASLSKIRVFSSNPSKTHFGPK